MNKQIPVHRENTLWKHNCLLQSMQSGVTEHEKTFLPHTRVDLVTNTIGLRLNQGNEKNRTILHNTEQEYSRPEAWEMERMQPKRDGMR